MKFRQVAESLAADVKLVERDVYLAKDFRDVKRVIFRQVMDLQDDPDDLDEVNGEVHHGDHLNGRRCSHLARDLEDFENGDKVLEMPTWHQRLRYRHRHRHVLAHV